MMESSETREHSRFERVALVVNGGLVTLFALLGIWQYRGWLWLVIMMGVGLIVTGLMNRCGTRAILNRLFPRDRKSD